MFADLSRCVQRDDLKMAILTYSYRHTFLTYFWRHAYFEVPKPCWRILGVFLSIISTALLEFDNIFYINFLNATTKFSSATPKFP